MVLSLEVSDTWPTSCLPASRVRALSPVVPEWSRPHLDVPGRTLLAPEVGLDPDTRPLGGAVDDHKGGAGAG